MSDAHPNESDVLLPERQAAPTQASPATAEALRVAPQAVRRSMPMALSISLGILLAGLVGWLAHYLLLFLLVIYLSVVAATIMEAPVQWLKRLGLGRTPAAILVMVGTLLAVVALLYLVANGVYGQIAAVSSNLEKAPDHINGFVNGMVQRHFPAMAQKFGSFDVSAEVARALPTLSTLWANAMWGVETVTWLVVMFFIVLYMLIDGADHLKAARCILPRERRLEATHVFNDLARAHRGWALASLANVASASIMTGIGLSLIGIPGAILMAFVAGCGELIPNIGPFLGALPTLLLTLLIMPEKFWWVVGMFVVVQTIQSYTISPQMLKFSVRLPVLVTIMSVLVFSILFGFLGLLVAVPLVADMVVAWQFLNRYLEKDTTDYDQVNARPYGRRTPMQPDNTNPGRLRRLFRRGRRADAAEMAGEAADTAGKTTPPDGLERLEAVERKASAKNKSDE